MALLIPRVFHQVWLGPDPLPAEFAGYRQSWIDHHPAWQTRLWTEENLPEDLHRPEVYERLRSPVERCDILRLELPHRFGGVYLDCDFECLRSIEPLLDDVTFFVGYTLPGRVNHAIMGAIAGHPILSRALEEINPREYFGYDKEATGPPFFAGLLEDYPDARIFDRSYFYAPEDEARATGYAVHHEAVSWKTDGELRHDLRKARARQLKWQRKATEEREKRRQAEAELARLRRRRGLLLSLRRAVK